MNLEAMNWKKGSTRVQGSALGLMPSEPILLSVSGEPI